MSILGHLETGNPKDVTQQDPTQRPQICLIGRCKDMMSSMDPMRALGMQEDASSLLASFVGRNYVKFRRTRVRTPRKSHGRNTLVLLVKASPLPFIATKRLAEGEPVNQQCTFHGRIHGSIHGRSQRCNNADSPCEHWIKSRTSRVLFLKLFRVQSVWQIQLYHFSGILPEKEVFSDSGSNESWK